MPRHRVPTPRLASAGALLAALALAQDEPPPDDHGGPGEPSGVAELFVKNCAACHGEDGDGKGTAQLDRQARSFRDGGFSFGNTPEALFRTITSGIPGTPMPAFDASLSDDERRALAEYVVTLGPPVEEVDLDATILRVSDRPLVVRGYLPPIAEGTEAHPRGLLIGATSGMTFEYRVDDVRLLGVRQGGFVQRKDWVGRGGAALEPLGRVVLLVEDGDPAAPFDHADGTQVVPLRARLAGSWVRDGRAGLTYRLETERGERIATVEETCASFGTSLGSGYRRELRFRDVPRTAHVGLRAHVYGERQDVARFGSHAGRAATLWTVWPAAREPDGADGARAPLHECVGVALPPGGMPPNHLHGVVRVPLELRAGAEQRVSLTMLTLAEWNDEAQDRLIEELR